MKDGIKEMNFPSKSENFRKVIDFSLRLFEDVDPLIPLSPFSAIPIISQALGLNTPLLGSGDSPYSIISIIFALQKKGELLQELFALPLSEKRRIIDEIYEMTAPSLLEEKDEYIDLLLDTKYACLTESHHMRGKELRDLLKEKFSILSLFIDRFDKKQGDFGYIAHYGYPDDLYREFDFLEGLSDEAAREWRNRSYPVVNEIFLRGFPQGDENTKRKVKGWVLFITNFTQELLEDGKLRRRKILQAAKLAERLGTKLIGMGGLITSFIQGGHSLSENIKDVGFTTGHAYTIGNIIEMMENCLNKVELNIKRASIAIVGAAGSIGSGCAKLLAQKGPGRIILIDLSTFQALKGLENVKNAIKNINSDIEVALSTSLMDIKTADVVISATNSPTSIISSEHLKPGTIIIDDAFPKNLSKKILDQRDDIILMEGGIMQFPQSIDIYFSRNMPDLMDVPLTRLMSCKESYGCVAEVFTLALYNYQKNYGLGQADPELARDILLKAKRLGFSSAPFQCFDEAIEEKRFQKVTGIIKRAQS